jgi:uncharacterized membrane-anchored protein YitT (DUF2179 family)
MEMAEINELRISAIPIILMLLGSILMLTAGLGFTSSNNAIFAGVACFIVSAFIERIFKKKK